jgi:type I restriction enzyme S subunit
MTIGLQNLSNQNFYNVKSVVPPLSEQREILEFVDAATRQLDRAINTTNDDIQLVKEYRTRLIVDVVTGKVDVRQAAFALTDEFADDAALDADDLIDEDDLIEDEAELDGIGEGDEA